MVANLSPLIAAAEQLVFVINTTEQDEAGPSTAAYLDEARWMEYWSEVLAEQKKATQSAKVSLIPIRANTNSEITKALELWMGSPLNSGNEVLGLAIHSHGHHMVLTNESEKFLLRLPQDLEQTFKPVVGRFSPNARVLLSGCDVLWGQSSTTAYGSLKSIAKSLGMHSGMIYSNSSKGIDPYTLFADPFNPDIKLPKRLAAFATYLLWPFSGTIVPLMSRFIYNQGLLFRFDHQVSQVL
ncbi:MAG: hypothetical protein J0L82_19040 [Deltaproteobacteria bacterium]|nr:hypothetical protein [Deltaproteobacteria bacterium]